MKRSVGTLVLVAGLLVAAAPAPKDDAAHKEADRMQGTWKAVSIETGGKADKSASAASARLVIDKDTLTFTERDQVVLAGTFKLDPTRRAIDVSLTQGPDTWRELHGIYELDRDTLKCCLARADQKERPTHFWTWRTTNLLVTLKR